MVRIRVKILRVPASNRVSAVVIYKGDRVSLPSLVRLKLRAECVSRIILSEQFVEENPELFKNTYAVDGEMAGLIFSDVVLKNKVNIKGQLEDFAYIVGGDPENMEADNYILCSENQMTKGMTSRETILFAVVFALLFVVCGYLLIYNVFDISVMQDVRQYGLLRTIGTSSRQIKKLEIGRAHV